MAKAKAPTDAPTPDYDQSAGNDEAVTEITMPDPKVGTETISPVQNVEVTVDEGGVTRVVLS